MWFFFSRKLYFIELFWKTIQKKLHPQFFLGWYMVIVWLLYWLGQDVHLTTGEWKKEAERSIWGDWARPLKQEIRDGLQSVFLSPLVVGAGGGLLISEAWLPDSILDSLDLDDFTIRHISSTLFLYKLCIYQSDNSQAELSR